MKSDELQSHKNGALKSSSICVPNFAVSCDKQC
jgi:hypothetical protein